MVNWSDAPAIVEPMTPTLWTGLIVMVLMLEAIRIALTTYVLLQVLESRALRRSGESTGHAGRTLRSAPARARREALYDPTLAALRAALDEQSAGHSGVATRRAVAALDTYLRALANERGHT
jgi:hypothetical protein